MLHRTVTWGYPTENAYYRDASSSDAILAIRIPFIAISALDDPVIQLPLCPNPVLSLTLLHRLPHSMRSHSKSLLRTRTPCSSPLRSADIYRGLSLVAGDGTPDRYACSSTLSSGKS